MCAARRRPLLTLETFDDPDEVVVVVRGELDVTSSPSLVEHLDRLAVAGASRVTLDCRHVAFVDASGLGALLAARDRLEGDGRAITLRHPSPVMRRLLHLADLSGAFLVEP
ncbi:MAG TPA: STAS domain-containing protein [Acidimicrobiales bacterium]|nr:STAS domain-containing protein [Acidimicrobiales bacterium]